MCKLATFYDHMKDIERQQGVSLFEAMQMTKALGVDYLEVSAGNLIGREDEVGHELAASGLGISSIPLFLDLGVDGDVYKQCSPTLEAAEYLGANRILVIPGFYLETDDPTERAQKLSRMEDGVNRLLELAQAQGISLIMEDFDSALAPFATAEQLLHFFTHCPGLTCAFDTGNFRYVAQDVLEAYEKLRGYITHVHLKDRAYQGQNEENSKIATDGTPIYPAPVGAGDLPLEKLMELLRQDKYQGIYTIEHYDSNRALDYLTQSVAWVKAALGKE